MATRCLICRQDTKGVVRGVYCHHDGYPSGVGALLYRCYSSAKAIDKLMRLGDLSSLGPRPTRGTKAFGYDVKSGPGGEDAPFVCERCDDIVEESGHCDVEWVYLWRDSAWYVAEHVWGEGTKCFARLETRLSGCGETERINRNAKNELCLAIELSLVKMYLAHSAEGTECAMAKQEKMAKAVFEKRGYVKDGTLTEKGIDVAWAIIEKYHMDNGIVPAE